MKDPLHQVSNQQELKMEWDGNRQEENSPQVSQPPDDTGVDNSRSVITARRHVRTITTAGHITEGTVPDQESESPVPSPVASNLQVIHGTPNQEQRYQEQEQHQHQHQQFQVQVSRGSSPNESGREQQHHITYSTNVQESVESQDHQETPIAISVSKEPPR